MENIAILDFGSQYTQLIARRARELGVYCEIHPHHAPPSRWRQEGLRGVILSGGPGFVNRADAPPLPPEVLEAGAPLLGLCYGMQALAAHFGGGVEGNDAREYGRADVFPAENEGGALLRDAFAARGGRLAVWMSHGDSVVKLPPEFSTLATNAKNGIAAIGNEKRKIYGLQFHPEVAHGEEGETILRAFVRDVCGCGAHWTPPNFARQAVEHWQKKLGGDKVILALSGGVDSAVCAALLHRAIGQNLRCVLVDTGLLRANEAEDVRAAFDGAFSGLHLRVVDAAGEFFAALEGVENPEEKRKRIGRLFIEIFEREAAKEKGAQWLAQGTIYPDIIESGAAGGKAAVIKSHHNVGGLPEVMRLKLAEPLRNLFKDEVRRLGEQLGLPAEFVHRHPFPGPGLAVRVLGEVTPARAEVARAADGIFIQELRAAGCYHQTAQAFAVLLPVRAVGVMGDNRTYENVVALRAVNTGDFMTAEWSRLPDELLARAARRIINEVAGVNRVVYDISSKPPATVEWE